MMLYDNNKKTYLYNLLQNNFQRMKNQISTSHTQIIIVIFRIN